MGARIQCYDRDGNVRETKKTRRKVKDRKHRFLKGIAKGKKPKHKLQQLS